MQAKRILVLLTILLIGAAVVPVVAQGTSEARGLVTDPEGNPLQGVKVTFRNTANETAVYDATTNKKGRYYVPGLLYYETGRWLVDAELEGYVPTKIRVESRTQTAVIAKFESQLGPEKAPPEIMIRAFGKAVIDFELTPEDQLAAEMEIPTTGGSEEAAEAPAVRKDPYETALNLVSSGDLEGSIPEFEKAIKDRPDDPERIEAFAKVLYRLERYGEAAAKAQAALDAGLERVGLYEVLYGARVETGDLEAAGTALGRALELQPKNRRLLGQSAWLAQATGDIDGAIEAYRTLTEIDPTNAEAWVALGGLYAEAGRMEDSRAAYEKVVEIDPSAAYQTFYNIGVLLENKDRPTAEDRKRAIEAYEKAVEIKPDYAAAWKRLGFARLGNGDRDGTREALRKYVELEPDAQDTAQVKAMLASLGG